MLDAHVDLILGQKEKEDAEIKSEGDDEFDLGDRSKLIHD